MRVNNQGGIFVDTSTVIADGAEASKAQPITFNNGLRCLFIASVILAIFSPTMVYVAAFSCFLATYSKELRDALPKLLRMLPVRLGLLYLVVALIGIFYTSAIRADIVKEILVIVFPVLFLPLLIPLFSSKVWQRRLLIGLLVSGTVLAARMLLDVFHWIPSVWSQHFFLFNVHYTQQSAVLTALGIYLSLYLTLEASTRMAKGAYISLAVFLIVVLLGFQGERVGMVLSFIALVMFFLQHVRVLRWILLMLVGYAALFGVIYHFSSQTHARLHTLVHETRNIKADNTGKQAFTSSTALRWYTAKSGLEASIRKPVFGYGTGAFAMSHKSNPPLTGDLLKYLNTTTPEVGGIFVLMRHGMVGLFIFIAFLFSWWWACRPLGYNRSALVFAALGVLVLADCSFPAFYHSRAWLWLFAVIITAAGTLFEKSKHENSISENR